MNERLKVEFLALGGGKTSGRVLETRYATFIGEAEFVSWAKKALPARRAGEEIWAWPEAVRACTASGEERFRWTIWDQLASGEAGTPLA